MRYGFLLFWADLRRRFIHVRVTLGRSGAEKKHLIVLLLSRSTCLFEGLLPFENISGRCPLDDIARSSV